MRRCTHCRANRAAEEDERVTSLLSARRSQQLNHCDEFGIRKLRTLGILCGDSERSMRPRRRQNVSRSKFSKLNAPVLCIFAPACWALCDRFISCGRSLGGARWLTRMPSSVRRSTAVPTRLEKAGKTTRRPRACGTGFPQFCQWYAKWSGGLRRSPQVLL